MDTGIFEENHYVDIMIEYAKAAEEDILIQLTLHNRSTQAAELDVIPTLWFRNTWNWQEDAVRPKLYMEQSKEIRVDHPEIADMSLYFEGNPAYEYFHGDNGRGLGAFHQTGWTGLVATLLHRRNQEVTPST